MWKTVKSEGFEALKAGGSMIKYANLQDNLSTDWPPITSIDYTDYVHGLHRLGGGFCPLFWTMIFVILWGLRFGLCGETPDGVYASRG